MELGKTKTDEFMPLLTVSKEFLQDIEAMGQTSKFHEMFTTMEYLGTNHGSFDVKSLWLVSAPGFEPGEYFIEAKCISTGGPSTMTFHFELERK